MQKHQMNYKTIVVVLTFLFSLLNPHQSLAQKQSVSHPEWSKNLAIYEANIRQYSPEGTFKAFEVYLPQLKELGVGIIWLMPIHPIGLKNRKGTLGSYYSVKDYKGINPEFGTLEDFKDLVNKIHELGMYVIIDWVANHTAWDHPWTASNPEFYTKDASGNFIPPFPDWSDVIDLNYENEDLRKEMIDAMKYWVTECDIDGFRCDVAAMVPTDFWNSVRDSLERIKPVFMLAEAHEPELHEKAFDMTYGWQFKDLMNDIAHGKKNVEDLDAYYNQEKLIYHPDAYRMIYTTNHDENSWNGTVYERLGDAVEISAVFTGVFKGMPLIYSGQEAGLNKALAFFEKDPIEWKEHKLRGIYSKLFNLKKKNKALWNGMFGGEIIRIRTTNDKNIYSFVREKDGDKIIAVFNFSPDKQIFAINSNLLAGSYINLFTEQKVELQENENFELDGWQYLIFTNTNFVSQDSVTVQFTYDLADAKEVSVAGSFNNWNPKAHIMQFRDSLWQVDVKLAPGYYYYKIVVDGKWIPDPNNPQRINDGGDSYNSIIKAGNPKRPLRLKNKVPFPKEALPEPVLEKNPEWVELYYAAWEMAWNKIKKGTKQNGFVDFYMDEGFNELIYQWDTCFMAAFGIYGNNIFPAMSSLDNFYRKQREDGYIQRVYWESNGEMVQPPTPDEPMVNPPLFPWLELRYYQITGDDSRLKKVLPILIKYYEWIENNCKSSAGKGLFYISPLGSGMDNVLRPNVGKAGWIDFSAQMALAANSISKIAEIVGEKNIASEFAAKFSRIKSLINKYAWDDVSQYYFDMTEDSALSNVKHIGAFWVLISEVAPDERMEALLNHLQNPKEFWRLHLVPALSADDPAYDPKGHYWLGGVWAPTNYMLIKGLEKYHQYSLAQDIAQNHIQNMAEVYYHFDPDEENIAFEERYADGYQTIWECYSPEMPKPATRWDNTFYSRQDFVGWSGLGPIAMLIENIIGLDIRGNENTIRWRISRGDIHGIRNIQLKKQRISLLCKPSIRSLKIDIECEQPFQLEVIWKNKIYLREINKTVKNIIIK